MSTSAFKQGVVVEIEGRSYQLIRQIESDLWQAEECRTKRIEEITGQQLRSFYVEGKLKFPSTGAAGHVASKGARVVSYSAEQWDRAKIRRTYVMATLDLPSTSARLIPTIQETWQKLQQPKTIPNAVTVYRWRQRFLHAGKDITALIEQNDRKGNKHSRYPVEVERIVEDAIDTQYLTQERGTIQDALDQAEAVIQRENALRPESIMLPSPTRRLVKRMIEAIPAFDRCAARYGRTAAVKRFRAVQTHRTTAAALERAEMDHSLADVLVIDDRTRLPLGRPSLTGCIDDHTRNALGLYVSFEPPSYFTVARCLKQAVLPKTWLRQAYPAIKNSWEAHGVMRELVVDNGAEFHSSSLENACYALGIEIHYAARKTPWFKGKIERFLGTLNRGVAHGTPGTTFHNVLEREEYDPSKHAVVRYSVFKEVVYTWIADVYQQRPHRALRMPPAVMWVRSVAPEDILVPDDPARLDAILGRSDMRRLTHKGIELDGLFYNSFEMTALRRRLGDKIDVEVRVDAADIGKIIVLSPDNRQMFSVSAIDSEYANGLSQWQHRICKRFASRESLQYCAKGWLEAKARIAQIIDAELMHKRQRTRTRIARYKGDSGLLGNDRSAHPRSEGPRESLTETTPETLGEATAPQSLPSVHIPTKQFKPIYRERTIEIAQAGEIEP